MSKAMPRTKRRRRQKSAPRPTVAVADFLKGRLTNPDSRSHAEFLRDMRTKQSAGRLANPGTAALLDQLERVIR